MPRTPALLLLLALPVGAQSIALERVATGFSLPVDLTAPPGDARLFVSQNDGRVFVIENGVTLPQPFMDLSALVHPVEGLSGIAFHPAYGSNGYVYAAWLDVTLQAQLVRFTVSATDPNQVDPVSATPILDPVAQPSHIHNWSRPLFGPDGMLYLPTGDGVPPGNQNDNFAQDLGLLYGKVLRLDVDAPFPHIPADNPFVGVPGAREEVWAFGLRNPWRASFDRLTGDLWLGDVGRASWEELDAVPAGSGGGHNFGWRCLEGHVCQGFAGCIDCQDPGLHAPLFEYRHGDGRCALVAGYVYRGAALPELQGRFFVGDFCTGRTWSLMWDGVGLTAAREESASMFASDGSRPDKIVGFGEDSAGELYILDAADGEVFRVIAACGEVTTYCDPAPNSTGSPALAGASGSLAVSDNSLLLSAFQLPFNRFGYFLFSSQTGFVPGFGGGQGNLCLGSPLVRFSGDVLASGSYGEMIFQPDLSNLPQGQVFAAGETWYFQLWYRDVNPNQTSNASNGVALTFCN